MKRSLPVQILLSTHNGARFLTHQLETLRSQDYPQISILIRDDGSNDDTLQILEEYCRKHQRFAFYSGHRMGAGASFFDLLEHADPDAAYYHFCDQDDHWLKDKLTRAVNKLENAPSDLPLLYCSRVVIGNAELKPLRLSDLPMRGLSFANAMVECPVWGSTVSINPKARELALKQLPTFFSMHDSWLYLIISAFGLVLYDGSPTMVHRRHDQNFSQIPATSRDRLHVVWRRYRKRGKECPMARQAAEFQRLFGEQLAPDKRAVLDRFLDARKHWWTRIRYACRREVYHQSRAGNLLLTLLLMLDRVYD